MMVGSLMFNAEVQDGVAVISFSGKRGNLIAEAGALARDIAADSSIRAALMIEWGVRAAPAAGPGYQTTPTIADALFTREEEARAMMHAWHELEKPVIAAVDADIP